MQSECGKGSQIPVSPFVGLSDSVASITHGKSREAPLTNYEEVREILSRMWMEKMLHRHVFSWTIQWNTS